MASKMALNSTLEHVWLSFLRNISLHITSIGYRFNEKHLRTWRERTLDISTIMDYVIGFLGHAVVTSVKNDENSMTLVKTDGDI